MINWTELFNMQAELDQRIIKEHELGNKDLFENSILALQVELGELANEWRGFKHWSNDQEPRREKMLVEYVDCLHFILSIGLQKNHVRIPSNLCGLKYTSTTFQFNELFKMVNRYRDGAIKPNYVNMIAHFIPLGELLGFTWDEIDSAYLEKNAINHKRQSEGY